MWPGLMGRRHGRRVFQMSSAWHVLSPWTPDGQSLLRVRWITSCTGFTSSVLDASNPQLIAEVAGKDCLVPRWQQGNGFRIDYLQTIGGEERCCTP